MHAAGALDGVAQQRGRRRRVDLRADLDIAPAHGAEDVAGDQVVARWRSAHAHARAGYAADQVFPDSRVAGARVERDADAGVGRGGEAHFGEFHADAVM